MKSFLFIKVNLAILLRRLIKLKKPKSEHDTHKTI